MTNRTQYLKIISWQKRTFPNSTSLSKAAHLLQEVKELYEAINLYPQYKDKGKIRHEIADCFILLMGIANSEDMTFDDIKSCVEEKMQVNYRRLWGTPDKDRVVNHIKDATDTKQKS